LEKLGEARLERPALFPQRQHLPVGKRDRTPAVRMGNADLGEHVGVRFEERRGLAQVASDIVSFQSRSPLQKRSQRVPSSTRNGLDYFPRQPSLSSIGPRVSRPPQRPRPPPLLFHF